MTKEKIIEMICATWIKDENGIPFILDYNTIADTLLAKIEQEKEEIFKNTLIKLIKFFNFNQNGTEASYSMGEIEDVIREFAEINGVEL